MSAYQHTPTSVFAYLIPVFAVGIVLAFLLPEKQLSNTNESAAAPVHV